MSDPKGKNFNVELNPSQREVALSTEKHVVVLAGAGTGKTAAIVHKVAHLIRGGVPRRSVMMITFTRRAASEMQKRIGALIKDVPKQSRDDAMLVGTYHAIASQLLRREAKEFGLGGSNFTTLDEDDANSLMKSAFRECDVTPGENVTPARVRAALSFAQNKRIPLEEHFREQFPDYTERALMLATWYRKLKKAANGLDYDDLLVVWARRMGEDAAYAQKLRTMYRHVICDEFQDNNALNYEILSKLNPDHLTVVGDVNQSIFGFRGASCGLVDIFLREHPKARVIRLEKNYRSGQKVLDLANKVVEMCPARPRAHQRARPRKPHGDGGAAVAGGGIGLHPRLGAQADRARHEAVGDRDSLALVALDRDGGTGAEVPEDPVSQIWRADAGRFRGGEGLHRVPASGLQSERPRGAGAMPDAVPRRGRSRGGEICDGR